MKIDESKPGRKKFIRQILAGTGIIALSGLGIKLWSDSKRSEKNRITGTLLGPSHKTGHLLREGNFPKPGRFEETGIVIAGGGITGLSAARWLLKNNISQFTLLELENSTGGNSASGENNISKYPWGAHYLPVPEESDKILLDFLVECGCITGFNAEGVPIYDEKHICFEPEERLFIHGQWQEGLIPHLGLQANESEQFRRFFEFTESLKGKKGRDGKFLFAIPLEQSSADEEWRQLDNISIAEWMNMNGYNAEPLKWYVNYCCRDDYGTPLHKTSAWAALHYFSGRNGSGINAPKGSVLTWPEGNGFLTKQLSDFSKDKIENNSLVLKIENAEGNVLLDVMDTQTGQVKQIRCRAAIFCGPQFVGMRIVKGRSEQILKEFEYAPWVVANVTLKRKPGGDGMPLSWDNVSYHSSSLGYIYSGHQNLKGFSPQETVLTWYHPLDEKSPKEERTIAFSKTWDEWKDMVVNDLERMHPKISEAITHIDCWVWGHAMISPRPGFIWGESRKRANEPVGNIFFAHSDLAGISIFEEAFHKGISAADAVLKKLKLS